MNKRTVRVWAWGPLTLILILISGWFIQARPGAAENPRGRTAAADPQLPVRWDWREHSGCTPVRDQGTQCDSSWAFATVGVLESRILIEEGQAVDLAEQQLVNCEPRSIGGPGMPYHDGCDFRYPAFQDLQDAGIGLEVCRPYTGTLQDCADACARVYFVESFTELRSGAPVTREEIKTAIYESGPVAALLSGTGNLHGYTGGVFRNCIDWSDPDSEPPDFNQWVVLVGWDDTLGGSGCWIAKNSFGPDWGDHGFIHVPYTCYSIGNYIGYVNYYLKGDTSNIPASERAALIAIYNAANGPGWYSSNWLGPQGSECFWQGVTCNPEATHVTGLTLDRGVAGQIPADIANLPQLDQLTLDGGNVYPYRLLALPPEIGLLSNLKILKLTRLNIPGGYPAALGTLTQLREMDLHQNAQSLGLPPWIGNLTELEKIDFNNNYCQGVIPDEWQNLRHLKYLDLFANRFSGPLPEWIGALSELEFLNLSSNLFDGVIPPGIGNLSRLRYLDLSYNSLRGRIPHAFCNLTSISASEALYLGSNALHSANPVVLDFVNQRDFYHNFAFSQTAPPQHLHWAPQSATGGFLRWDPSPNPDLLNGFQIFYRQGCNAYTMLAGIPNKYATYFPVTGLFPANDYTFMVNSYTDRAILEGNTLFSDFSQPLTVAPDQDPPDYDLFIPAAAHTAGANGTFWRTDIDLCNPGSEAAAVELFLLRKDQGNPNPLRETVDVPAGRTVRLTGVLASLFDADNAAIGLRFNGKPVLANARFYTTAASSGGNGGRYGMIIPAVGEGWTLSPETPGVFHQLSNSPDPGQGFRTNIGFVNARPFSVQVRVNLFGDDGFPLGGLGYTLQPYEHHQITRIHDQFGNPVVTHGFATVEVLTPCGRVHAYAMVIDNVSGDPVYIPAENPAAQLEDPDGFYDAGAALPVGGYNLYLPAAAHTGGVNNTFWKTDVDLYNPGVTDATAEIAFLLQDRANPQPTLTAVTVPHGRTVRLPDILGSFSIGSNAALGIRTHGGPILADARFYTSVSPAMGTFGMYIPTVGSMRVLPGDGQSLGVFHHLSFSPNPGVGFRTNIGFVSASGFNVVVRVRLFGDDGQEIGSFTHTLLPWEHRQFTRVHQHVGAPAVDHGHATVEVLTPHGMVHAYAMLIDNISGDPVYMPVEVVRP